MRSYGPIEDRFGSRRGLIATLVHRLLYRFGAYSRYERIDWSGVRRVIFVCKGNICRSAFAEAVARRHGLQTLSCGIEAGADKPAHARAIEAAASRGYDLAEHRTTRLSAVRPDDGDLYVMMEPAQAKVVEAKTGRKYQYSLLGVWETPSLPYVHDPYSASKIYFDNCFAYIEAAVTAICRKLL